MSARPGARLAPRVGARRSHVPCRSHAPRSVVGSSSRRVRTTIVVSLAAHAVVVLAVVVVPLFAQIRLPSPARPISAYVMAAAYEDVPLPAPPGRASADPSSLRTLVLRWLTSPRPRLSKRPQTIGSGTHRPCRRAVCRRVEFPGRTSSRAMPACLHRRHWPSRRPLPRPSHPLRVGGDIRAPRKLQHVAPVYPPIAAQARVSGTVILEATISPTGEVVDVRVLRSVPLLDAAAVAAVRQWRYDAPRLNGTPVAVLLTVTVQFAQ